jgi:hypothetical protein
MDIDLTKYTELELIELNQRIVERIRLMRQGRCRETMAEFSIGDRVTFQPERGREVSGVVVRLNRKSVTVVTSDGVHWRVAPAFLTKAQGDDSGRDGPAPTTVHGELINLAMFPQRDRGKA